jgi:hypothetical protein
MDRNARQCLYIDNGEYDLLFQSRRLVLRIIDIYFQVLYVSSPAFCEVHVSGLHCGIQSLWSVISASLLL